MLITDANVTTFFCHVIYQHRFRHRRRHRRHRRHRRRRRRRRFIKAIIKLTSVQTLQFDA